MFRLRIGVVCSSERCMGVRCLLLVFLLSLAAYPGNASSSETGDSEKALEEGKAVMAHWRARGEKEGFTNALASDAITELLDTVPRYLPATVEAYRREEDEEAAEFFEKVIEGQASFISTIYLLIDPDLMDSDPAAELKTICEKGSDRELSFEEWQELTVWDRRSKLLAWWDHRGELLECGHLREYVHQVVGKTPGEFRAVEGKDYNTPFELALYGIYSLPCLIDIIFEDNNPFAFSEFISTAFFWELFDIGTIEPRSVLSEVWLLDARFPTREAKLRRICEWWSENQDNYRSVPDLYQALEKRLDVMCDADGNLVKDPVQGFVGMVEDEAYRNPLFLDEGERIETVQRIDVDIDGDGHDEVFVSSPQFIDGRKRNIWHLYVKKDGGYQLSQARAFKADTLHLGEYKDRGHGLIWYDYRGGHYRPEFKIRFSKLEHGYIKSKKVDRFPPGKAEGKSHKSLLGDDLPPPGAEKAMREKHFPNAKPVKVQEIPVTAAMREQWAENRNSE